MTADPPALTPGHLPAVAADPVTRMVTLTCECGWVKTWAFRTPLLRWHRAHVEAAP